MKKKILVVDDETIVTKLVAAILNSTHLYEVETTNNSCEAFEWAFTRGYDLLIADIRMPLMDGDQLYASLTELNGVKPPKLLLMSGAFKESELAQRVGNIFYLQKPFVPELLLAKVAYVFANDERELGSNTTRFARQASFVS